MISLDNEEEQQTEKDLNKEKILLSELSSKSNSSNSSLSSI
jgi:hypothetical protein